MDAFSTDVRPLLCSLREEMGIDPDPLAADARSAHASTVVAARGTTYAAGWGQ